jgi:hypothetical protein
MLRALAIGFTLAASLAGAESNTLTGQPGFFKATPDGNSSISRIVPLEEAAPKNETVAAAATPNPAPPPAPATVAKRPETTAERAHDVEPDFDRAEREHREMTLRSAQAASPVEGAFNGATSARDR